MRVYSIITLLMFFIFLLLSKNRKAVLVAFANVLIVSSG